jgi:hypothetical protein
LSRARHDFLDQQDQIFAILKERKSLWLITKKME